MPLTDEEAKEYQKAIKRFMIPKDCEHFLFILPPFFVAKADGNINLKEAISVPFILGKYGLVVKRNEEEKEKLDIFVGHIFKYITKQYSKDDMTLLAKAINYKLRELPPEFSKAIRIAMYKASVEAAESSGPLFRDKVSKEEREMLDMIFGTVGKGVGKTK